MKFKGRNGGFAVAMHSHIMLFRAFVITLLIALVPTIIFICINDSYFWVFLILPLALLAISYAVFFFSKYDDRVFLSNLKKDHTFEIKNNSLFKDGKEIKLIRSVKIYRYKKFLFMETSHSMFVIKDTDFISGDRECFLSWAKSCDIRILCGY